MNSSFSYSDSDTMPNPRNHYKIVVTTSILTLAMASVPYADYIYDSACMADSNIEYRIECQCDDNREEVCNVTVDGQKITNRKILKKMSVLENDWNGYGGESFSKEKIDFFSKLIDEIHIQPTISPTGRGTLYLEYRNQKGTLGFEVFEDRIDVAYIFSDGNFTCDVIHSDFGREINKIVGKYYE